MVLSSEIEQLKQQQQLEQLKTVPLAATFDHNHNKLNRSESPKPAVLLHRHIENLKIEEGVAASHRSHEQDKEETSQSRRGSTNSETAHIIEEIIEGIALKGRRGTLVRTISAVLR